MVGCWAPTDTVIRGCLAFAYQERGAKGDLERSVDLLRRAFRDEARPQVRKQLKDLATAMGVGYGARRHDASGAYRPLRTMRLPPARCAGRPPTPRSPISDAPKTPAPFTLHPESRTLGSVRKKKPHPLFASLTGPSPGGDVAGDPSMMWVRRGAGPRPSGRAGEGISLATGQVRFSGQALDPRP